MVVARPSPTITRQKSKPRFDKGECGDGAVDDESDRKQEARNEIFRARHEADFTCWMNLKAVTPPGVWEKWERLWVEGDEEKLGVVITDALTKHSTKSLTSIYARKNY